jgi:hypothetical protein
MVAQPMKGAVPIAVDVLETIRRATEVLLGRDAPTERVVPVLARIQEERTDALGWTRCTLEDELGRTIESTSYGNYHDLFGRHFFVFQRTNPVAIRPHLVVL